MRKKYSEYSNHKIILENKTRNFSILPQACEYGYITGCVGVPMLERIFFRNKLEICIRISCSKERLTHSINNVKYENSYPHCLIKPPCGSYHLTDITQRDVFYILYPQERFSKISATALHCSTETENAKYPIETNSIFF